MGEANLTNYFLPFFFFFPPAAFPLGVPEFVALGASTVAPGFDPETVSSVTPVLLADGVDVEAASAIG